MNNSTYKKSERNICKKICVVIIFLCAFISLYEFLQCPLYLSTYYQSIYNIYDLLLLLLYIFSAILLLIDVEYQIKHKIIKLCFIFISISTLYYLFICFIQSLDYELLFNTYFFEGYLLSISMLTLRTSFLYSEYDECLIYYTDKYWAKKNLITKDDAEKIEYWKKRFNISYNATLCSYILLILLLFIIIPDDLNLLFKPSRAIKILPILLLVFTILIKNNSNKSNKKGFKFVMKTNTKTSYISSITALFLSVICFIIPLYTNLLTISSSITDQKYSLQIQGTDVVSEIHNIFEIIKKSSAPETEIIKNLIVFSLSIMVGIALIILALIWLVRAINEFIGESYSTFLAKGAIVVLILFCFMLIILSKTWAEFFSEFYIIIDVSTETIAYTILAIVLSALYLFINKKEIREAINQHKNSVKLTNEVVDLDQETSINVYQSQHTEDDIIDLLQKYKSLLDSGIITEEDFQQKKEELLNNSNK